MIFIVFFSLVVNTTLEGVHVDFIPGNEKILKNFYSCQNRDRREQEDWNCNLLPVWAER